jgi:hypothetical protein
MPNRAKKVRLTRAEKIERDIRLAYRKQERAVEMREKADRMLRSSAISLASLHKAKRRLEAKAADALVETAAAPPPPPVPEPVPKPNGDGAPKPKRQRKPKPKAETLGESCDRIMTETIMSHQPKADREARMKSLGFHKTSR